MHHYVNSGSCAILCLFLAVYLLSPWSLSLVAKLNQKNSLLVFADRIAEPFSPFFTSLFLVVYVDFLPDLHFPIATPRNTL